MRLKQLAMESFVSCRAFFILTGVGMVMCVSMLLVAFYLPAFANEGETKAGNEEINQNTLQKRLSGDVESGLKPPPQPDLAFGAFQRGEYLTAFNLALPRARAGDAAAQTLIAELYDKGLGIPQDQKEAANWYRIAAETGNREARFAYGLKLLEGKIVEKDIQRGQKMMEKAALDGHPVAMFNHANQIIADRPTSAGYRLALPFYEKAAENNVSDAYYALAVIYREGRATGFQEPEKARAWLERAARAGVDTAQVELAIDLLNGTDGKKNPDRAFNLMNNAAISGNVIAQNRLAHMYRLGIGAEPSNLEAAKWHILAKRAGRFDIELDTFVAALDEETRKKAIALANRWPGA